MIQVKKSSSTPMALKVVQDDIEKRLLEEKKDFKWNTDHYSRPIKEDLKRLYHNKCAFCEQKLTMYNTGQLFTIEHFRPKSIYWWLGNEWTNLFPTCQKCNDNKEDEFKLHYGDRRRVKVPTLKSDGTIDRTACDAAVLAVEEPYFIHPEVDQPEKFFTFLPNGRMEINKGLSNWEQARAKMMLDKFLNRASLVEKRLSYINTLQDDLQRSIKTFSEVIGHGYYDENHIKLCFFPFLKKLFTSTASKLEFSRLGYFMSSPTTFYSFFLEEETEEVQKLILEAVELYTTASS